MGFGLSDSLLGQPASTVVICCLVWHPCTYPCVHVPMYPGVDLVTCRLTGSALVLVQMEKHTEKHESGVPLASTVPCIVV